MIRGGPGQILHFDWLLPSDAWRAIARARAIRHGIEYPDPALLIVLNQQPCITARKFACDGQERQLLIRNILITPGDCYYTACEGQEKAATHS